MDTSTKSAASLHKNVPPDHYYRSVKTSLPHKFWHTKRYRKILSLSEKVSGKILDIGCADGVFTQKIQKKTSAKKVIGVDVLVPSITWAKRHWKNNQNLEFFVGNAHKLKFADDTFDAVYALEVMEHIQDPRLVIREIFRVLKKGGYAIALVPTDSEMFKFGWFFWTKYGPGRIWDDTHIQSFNKDNKLAKAFKKQGFKVENDDRFLCGMLNVVKARKV